MLFKKLYFFQGLLFLLVTSAVQSQPANVKNEFVLAIVEFSQSENNGQTSIKIISSKSVHKKLKSPTPSEKILGQDLAGFHFEVLDQNQKVLDRIHINDPLTVDYEYVDDNGNLAHKLVRKEKRVMIIRRNIGTNATFLALRPRLSVRSDDFVISKIDRS